MKLRVREVRRELAGFQLRANFEIAGGERVALLGRSGSGKTTLLRILAGLETWTPGGEGAGIFLGEESIGGLPPERRGIGMVAQDPALFPALNLLENVAFGLRMRGVGKREREAEALPWLERVGLSRIARDPIGRLSGGERQRAAFVRAIVWKPRLLLFDEPFSALDPALRATLKRELLELHRLWPVPLLLVTHDLADAEAIATKRLHFQESEDGRIRNFVDQPEHL